MKYLRLALLVFASTLGLARAQDEEERRAPPTEIPDFSNLDEYIYEPKSTVTIGIRHLSGPKTQFAGQGRIVSPEDAGPTTGNNITRNYHDGTVSPDARFVPRVDSSGNPVIDPDSNGQVFDKVAPDGKTNTWAYGDARQASEAPGYVAFHTYSANIVDTATRSLDALSSLGLDLTVTRDMGQLFGTRMTWNLTAGMSANDISAKTSGYVLADRLTRTDYYSLFGQTAPSAPYSAPSSTTQTVLDAAGNTVTNTDGSSQLVSVDTTVLISDQPVASMSSSLRDATSVTSRWKLKGAYYTFRAGPTIWIPITSRFRASFSFGPALVYAGTDYTVTETFTPDIGADLTDTNSSQTYHLMPGYYADANLQFDITERAGLYAGAVFQSAGTYKQNLDAENAHYTTKVDLSNQSGLRAGMTVRF